MFGFYTPSCLLVHRLEGPFLGLRNYIDLTAALLSVKVFSALYLRPRWFIATGEFRTVVTLPVVAGKERASFVFYSLAVEYHRLWVFKSVGRLVGGFVWR